MKHDLQQLAETLRNAAYSDGQSHKLDWSLYIVHPKTNDGDVGFSGGIWRNVNDERRSLHLSFSETKGIHDIKIWTEAGEIFLKKRTLNDEELKKLLKKHFSIDKFYGEAQ